MSNGFKERYRAKGNFFCRERIFTFATVMLAILNNISKSLGVELTKFLQRFGNGQSGSKQAFSKARYKIEWEAFASLNDTFVKAYYAGGGFRLYAGKYLLLAADGSDYQLPWTEELVSEFGAADNKQNKQPMCMAKGLKIWDTLNQLTVSSTLGRYDVGETEHFKPAWQKAVELLAVCGHARPLLLGDMRYPSFWLIHQMSSTSCDFVFRCSPTFCREIALFMSAPAPEAMIKMPIGTDKERRRAFRRQTGAEQAPLFVNVRALKFTRPNGELTCLITSVPPQVLDYQSVCGLYPYRWGEEVSFNFDKNRAEIENFSAKMPQGVKQDWHANILATNLAQLLIEDAQELLDQEQQAKHNKYHYQINRSVALGIIKDELPKMLFGKEKPSGFHKRMVRLIALHREPVRPGRTFPREKKHRLRFSMNLRRVI